MANISHHSENEKDSNDILNMNSAKAYGVFSPTTSNLCYESLETSQSIEDVADWVKPIAQIFQELSME